MIEHEHQQTQDPGSAMPDAVIELHTTARALAHNGTPQGDALAYAEVLTGVREVVEQVVPAAATVVVVSKGDDALLQFAGRQGWHFPRNDDGVYAGYYPADGTATITHLEELRAKGGGYLLFPRTAFWWLESDIYAGFREHLDSHYYRTWSDDRCIIYRLRASALIGPAVKQANPLEAFLGEVEALRSREAALRTLLLAAGQHWQLKHNDPPNAAVPSLAQPWAAPRINVPYPELITQIREIVRTAVPRGATIIVLSKGDDALLKFERRKGWHFPQTRGGTYAGHYPADGTATITHLEELRAKGGGYLLFPRTAFWWLESDIYAGFREHLDSHYYRTWSDDRCIIYRLQASEGGTAVASQHSTLRRALTIITGRHIRERRPR